MRRIWSPDPGRETREALAEANRVFERRIPGKTVPVAIIILATLAALVLAYSVR